MPANTTTNLPRATVPEKGITSVIRPMSIADFAGKIFAASIGNLPIGALPITA